MIRLAVKGEAVTLGRMNMGKGIPEISIQRMGSQIVYKETVEALRFSVSQNRTVGRGSDFARGSLSLEQSSGKLGVRLHANS